MVRGLSCCVLRACPLIIPLRTQGVGTPEAVVSRGEVIQNLAHSPNEGMTFPPFLSFCELSCRHGRFSPDMLFCVEVSEYQLLLQFVSRTEGACGLFTAALLRDHSVVGSCRVLQGPALLGADGMKELGWRCLPIHCLSLLKKSRSSLPLVASHRSDRRCFVQEQVQRLMFLGGWCY
jgi:hypothetical protein